MGDREVEIDITAKDRTSPAVKGAADGLDTLGKKSKDTERKLGDLGDETGVLGRKMAATQAEAKRLAREFDRTGDTSLLKDIEKLNREATRLGRAFKLIQAPKVEGGGGFGQQLLSGLVDQAKKAGLIAGEATVKTFGQAFQALPSTVQTPIVAGAAAGAALAAPIIAGAIEGAVLIGVGGGALAAGIALAVRDPAVSSAFGNMWDDALAGLDRTTGRIRSELREVPAIFAAGFEDELPRIERIFNNVSRAIQPLARGGGGFLKELGPGLESASRAAVPLLSMLARQLPALGRAAGNLLDAFAGGGEGAAAALELLIGMLTTTINLLALGARASAPFLNAFGAMAGMLGLTGDNAEKASWQTGDMAGSVGGAGSAASGASQTYEDLAASLGNTANQAKALNESFDRLFNETMNLDAANLAAKQAWLELVAAAKEHGTSLDQNTQKGLSNTEMVQQQVRLLQQKMQAEVAAGNGTAEAYATAQTAYAGSLASLRQNLINLGFNAAEVDKLIAKYQELALPQTKTFTTVYRTKGTPPGYSDQKTGHSQNPGVDTSALASWAPAQFAARSRFALAAVAADGDSGSRAGGPVELHSEHTINVSLDGQPFRRMVTKVVNERERRQAWRAKVGRR